ncbi:Gfo/Idh/MocA family protein [Bacillus sp. FJAT-45037]|uniref:Gfo/Idh/MocA family protein n=1 Tax=Bacillus sp. FJAT-45037 TaxID=2011007 RepID=UPI000C23B2B7|nr:Gfo/Idh/MocA family oxidoreductase [Bacillus sp. FJAT-45037]
MERLRVGIVGVGGIATSRHIPAFLAIPDMVDVVAVFDQQLERAVIVAEELGIPFVAKKYEELLDAVDAVVICTPNRFHSELAVTALSAGCHVLCEKPMATSVEECKRMLEAANQANKKLMIAYHYRFMKEAQAAKRLIDAGEVGMPLVIRVQALRRRKVPGWGVFTNHSLQGGGCLMDYGCHLLDLALWLTGHEEIESITGRTYEEISRNPNEINEWGSYDTEKIDVEDHATAYITFKNGASLLFETSWAANIEADKETLSISGTSGGLDVFPLALNQSKHGMLQTMKPDYIEGADDPSVPQATNFVKSALGLEPLLVEPEQAMEVNRIIEAIYSQSGKRENQ